MIDPPLWELLSIEPNDWSSSSLQLNFDSRKTPVRKRLSIHSPHKRRSCLRLSRQEGIGDPLTQIQWPWQCFGSRGFDNQIGALTHSGGEQPSFNVRQPHQKNPRRFTTRFLFLEINAFRKSWPIAVPETCRYQLKQPRNFWSSRNFFLMNAQDECTVHQILATKKYSEDQIPSLFETDSNGFFLWRKTLWFSDLSFSMKEPYWWWFSEPT